MDRSRIPEFYKLSVADRVRLMRERGWLTEDDYQALVSGEHTLKVHSADKMIENVVGVMGLPVGLGMNFLINGKDYIVPLVVEEPSIVAALSSAAKIFRKAGGFTVESTEPILIGQVQVVDLQHVAKAQAALLQRKEELINLANSLHPQMVARGGGARDLEVHVIPLPAGSPGGRDMIVVHLLVDTRDAMGANLVNTMCEGIAPLVESITGGKVFLRILSNLTDRATVRARAVVPVEILAGKGYSGEEVRDGVIIANDFASVDPYRAATHNKGIMNGVDAVALATGNDWRAIEAAAHAYAARSGRYTSLTRWYKGDKGELVGELEIPMKVGTVGGPLQSNPTVALNHRLLGVKSGRELAEVMGAVGLAQNFSALKALVTDGIQQGHMTLHARSVAVAAGAAPEIFDTVVERLIESGDIKIWKAQQIIAELYRSRREATEEPAEPPRAAGHGKIILLGEHAVVYGSHAIAAPVPLAIQARARETGDGGVAMVIPRWGVEYRLHKEPAHRDSFQRSLGIILDRLELTQRSLQIEVFPNVPRAMGLGGSAAMAVGIIRALDDLYQLGLRDEQVNAIAYECEKVAHGTPSGIDNTVATYGQPILYKRADRADAAPVMRPLQIPKPIRFVIGISGKESLTAKTVGRVREAWQKNPELYERIFREIDGLTLQAVDAVAAYDLERLGDLMNVCHGLLNALRVSSWEIEELVQIARDSGALGAKLTGGGGGGSIIALCPDGADKVMQAIRGAGYQAMEVQLG
jgi:hydroxymethylglutaryl-CoA reductase